MEEIMKTIAGLMAVSARTAPKAAGQDYVEIKVITGDDLERLADWMEDYGQQSGKRNFDRDGENMRNSDAVLLLSLDDPATVGLDCGACGYERCADLQTENGPEFAGALCAWRILDLGIALGSAAKTASILNADNRIMYRIGVVARLHKMISGELVVGIPIAATGKNVYFDRK